MNHRWHLWKVNVWATYPSGRSSHLLTWIIQVHFNTPMNTLKLKMYHQIKNVISVNLTFCEYLFRVDTDTAMEPFSQPPDFCMGALHSETRLIYVWQYYFWHDPWYLMSVTKWSLQMLNSLSLPQCYFLVSDNSNFVLSWYPAIKLSISNAKDLIIWRGGSIDITWSHQVKATEAGNCHCLSTFDRS